VTRKRTIGFMAGVVLSVALFAVPTHSSEGAASQATLPRVRTLLTIRGPVEAFAQDGRYVAWSKPHRLVIRRLDSGAESALGVDHSSSVVLGGRRALWLEHGCGNLCYDYVYSAALGDRRARLVDEEGVSMNGDDGTVVHGLAADGGAHLFAVLSIGSCNGDEYNLGSVVDGWIGRVSGKTSSKALELPASRLAVNAGRVAALPPVGLRCLGNSSPAWSPDAGLIAFSHREGAAFEIEVVSPAGAGRRTLVLGGDQPAWVPDGSSLAFVTPDSIRAIRADGTRERTVVSCADFCYAPDWAPDGSKLAFGRNRDLYTANADGSGERQLTHTPEYESDPSWSPDGKKIAFTRGDSVYVMDAAGGNEQRLGAGYQPSFSPDGTRIAFGRRRGRNTPQIYVMRSDGTGVRRLTNDRSGSGNFAPDWSPDGRQLAFVGDASGQPEIQLVDADGTARAPLTDDRPPIEVHRLQDRALVSRFRPGGRVLELALSPQFAAVLVGQGQTRRIALFDPNSGAAAGAVRVPSGSRRISIAAHTVVFDTGRTIWALDAASRQRRILATASSAPIGLSIERRRVAWAESGKQRSRIRAIFLP
jgi:dipeptidyl aminopeptidase/acylaminoacyl peptidase